jgi:chromosome segregation ATPase
MFKSNREKALQSRIDDLTGEKERLEEKNDNLNSELLQHKRTMQEREDKIARDEKNLKHEIKLKEERMDLAHEKKRMELEAEHQKAIGALNLEFHKKTEGELRKAKEDLMGQYKQLMDRLPDINVALKGKVTD